MANCDMEMGIAKQNNNEIILEDGSRYYYTTKPFEITNPLGIVIAVLDEFSIKNKAGENYKLYQTKEGNWYDNPITMPAENNSILRGLKQAIEKQYIN